MRGDPLLPGAKILIAEPLPRRPRRREVAEAEAACGDPAKLAEHVEDFLFALLLVVRQPMRLLELLQTA
jgi:hypothetical protein